MSSGSARSMLLAWRIYWARVTGDGHFHQAQGCRLLRRRKRRLELSREQQERFLLPLVEKNCIDYREFKADRDARPLFTGVRCVATGAAKGGRDSA